MCSGSLKYTNVPSETPLKGKQHLKWSWSTWTNLRPWCICHWFVISRSTCLKAPQVWWYCWKTRKSPTWCSEETSLPRAEVLALDGHICMYLHMLFRSRIATLSTLMGSEMLHPPYSLVKLLLMCEKSMLQHAFRQESYTTIFAVKEGRSDISHVCPTFLGPHIKICLHNPLVYLHRASLILRTW